MPRRIVDGERTWRSSKLRQVAPEAYRAEYTWLLPLANDIATFECDPVVIRGVAYSINRPSVTVEDVKKFLEEFERVKLLYRWCVGDKVWGYWVGMDQPGLLPKPSERYSKDPRPNPADLKRFLGGTPAGDPRQVGDETSTGIGLGFGVGSGEGLTENTEGRQQNPGTQCEHCGEFADTHSTPPAESICPHCGWAMDGSRVPPEVSAEV
jgi:hypothetical protein